jgi:hypothetical protein
MKTGSTLRVRRKADMEVHDSLPVGTYTVHLDERAGEFFLEQIEDFDLPKKIYGNSTNYADRILSTFNSRPLSTGVLLSGIKGAGKTLLAKQTSVKARDIGIPTIVINKPWHGDMFNSFIQSLDAPAIVMFDEFEKVYDYQEQRAILTLLDGVFPTKKLFLLTTNTTGNVSEFLRNRPGRIFYNFEFSTLGEAFIREYCEDNLDDQDQVEDVVRYTNIFSFFNFDMLAAAVEEMNRYGETLAQVLDVLNIVPETQANETYELKLVMDGREFLLDKNFNHFSPNQFTYTIWADDDMPEQIAKDKSAKKAIEQLADKEDYGSNYFEFGPQLICNYDQVQNKFTYRKERNGYAAELHATRNKVAETWRYNPSAF